MLSQEEQNISENVQRLMDEHDPPLSTRRLAGLADINPSTLQKFLQAKHQPRYAMIKTLADFFRVSIEDLEKTPRRRKASA